MSEDIVIEDSRGRLGSITIVRDLKHLHVERMASGFELRLPLVLTLRVRSQNEPMLMIDNLRGHVFAKNFDGSLLGVGTVVGERQTAGISSRETYNHSIESYLTWIGNFEDMISIEKVREGQTPKLQLNLRGDWCFLLPTVEEIDESRWSQLSELQQQRIREYAHHRILTEPQSFSSRMGYIEVSYPREVWIAMIRNLGIAENVLVEVPLPRSPSDPWAPVWNALLDARNAFEQGGSNAWQSTVTSVRLALEKWRGIEQEVQGAGWTRPSRSDLESRTKKQRLDALRWHLMQIAHLGPHTGADEWSRDDALLMLTTLSVLLVERKP